MHSECIALPLSRDDSHDSYSSYQSTLCAVGLAQGLSDSPASPFNIRRAADKLLFGVLFLNNGILSKLAKMGWIKRRDEIDPDVDPPLRVVF